MLQLRNRPRSARFAFFGLGLCGFALTPTEVGYQDVASRLARQPGVAERWHRSVFASVGTIHVAAYSFNVPIGTAAPQAASYQLASLSRQDRDVTGSLPRNPAAQTPPRYQASDFPKVDRTLKGDRLIAAPPQTTVPADVTPIEKDPAASYSVMGAKTADVTPPGRAPLDPELVEALSSPPLTQYGALPSIEAQPLHGIKNQGNPDPYAFEHDHSGDGFSVKTANLFFGTNSLGAPLETIERWRPGEEPVVVMPDTADDPDMKMIASLPPTGDEASRTAESGESIAAKGEVNSDNQRAKTPAERLGLFDEKTRAKSEKCLAEAVYFESRGEAVRGQIAVAQVVMNRAFSGFYPTTVCGVVYQNKHRHLACQFTFACDNIADVVREPDMWDRAKKIAKAMLDGQLWLPEVGKSTHYHAYWVRPSWVSEMKKMYKFGVHTFYRPRAWGDGSEAPSWGSPAETAAISSKLAEAAQSSAEQANAKR